MSLLLKENYTVRLNEQKLNEMRERDRQGKPVVVVGVIQRANSKNQNGRIYPKDILSKEVDRYKNEVIGSGNALGELDHCLLGENEVLTTKGWKRLDQIDGSEKVQTYNTNTGNIEISPVLKTHKFFYEGKMLRLTNKKKLDITMTPNHRMLLWDRYNKPYYLKAEDAFQGWKEKNSRLSHSTIKSSGEWVSDKNSTDFLPKLLKKVPTKAMAGLFGLWLAEGHVAGSKGGKVHSYEVVIRQKKEDNIEKIQELLRATELKWTEYKLKSGKYEWTLRDKDVHNWFSNFGNSQTKYIPEEFLNWDKQHLEIMFDWMLLEDGRNRKSPTGELIKEYSTTSSKLAENVSELIFKLGHRSFIEIHKPEKDLLKEGRTIKKENCNKIYTIALNNSSTSMDSRFINFEEVNHNDYVYCITTKNHNFLTRSPNGYVCWTGNTDEPIIQLERVSHIIDDVWWDGPNQDEVWGKIRLLDTPKGEIAKKIVLQGIPLGISSRAVGSVDSKDGCDYVKDDLNLICWDLVGTPSTDKAYLRLHEAKEIKNFNPQKVLPAKYRIKETLKDLLSK